MLLLGLTVQSASAQPLRYQRPQVNPYGTPTVSPYLNIASGMNPAISYYGIVRPTVQAQQFQQSWSDRAGRSDRAECWSPSSASTTTTTTGVMPITGASSVFMNYGGYFNTIGGQRVGMMAPPPGLMAPIQQNQVPIGQR